MALKVAAVEMFQECGLPGLKETRPVDLRVALTIIWGGRIVATISGGLIPHFLMNGIREFFFELNGEKELLDAEVSKLKWKAKMLV